MHTESADDVRLQAATLAFALLRFSAGAAHPDRSSTPKGVPRVGPECYVFAPAWTRIAIADVPQFFATLPAPALLASTTTRGFATLILINELTGERREWADHSLGNQQAGLESSIAQLGLGADARVILQFDSEEYVYPLPVLREWCAQFGVAVGWNLRPYHDDDRAQARLMLYRSDGEPSWGDAWPLPRRPDDRAT